MITSNLLKIISFKPKSLQLPNAWVGHLPFAYWLIEEQKPKVFVELGTHSGNSYFSFCQSVVDSGIGTRCFAIDTWQGDEHAGEYKNEVFDKVNSHNLKNYANFSQLLRMTFDEATTKFSAQSVELLHIDGLHTYDAVRHDFETWLPKLAPGAVVLFHDTNVFERNFGVWKLWQELKLLHPGHLEFTHSHGLGVLQLNNAPENKKLTWLYSNESDKKNLVDYFEILATKNSEKTELKNMALQVDQLSQLVAERDQRINEILTSNSWKLSSPLRTLSKNFTRYNRNTK
jgi:Methyltransferase domain